MRVTEIIADLQLTDLEAAKDVHTGYLGLTVGTYSVNPGPPGLLRSQGSEQDGACRAVSSGAAVR